MSPDKDFTFIVTSLNTSVRKLRKLFGC